MIAPDYLRDLGLTPEAWLSLSPADKLERARAYVLSFHGSTPAEMYLDVIDRQARLFVPLPRPPVPPVPSVPPYRRLVSGAVGHLARAQRDASTRLA